MFSSIIAGIRDLQPDREAFFLLPVDIPLVRPQTVRDLLEALSKTSGKILYPVFRGKRGHPPLIAADFVKEIRCWKGDGGFRAFLGQYESQSRSGGCRRIYSSRSGHPRGLPGIVLRYPNYAIPSLRECRVLLTHKFPVATRFSPQPKSGSGGPAFGRGTEPIRRPTEFAVGRGCGPAPRHSQGPARSRQNRGKNFEKIGVSPVAKIVGTHADIFPRKRIC